VMHVMAAFPAIHFHCPGCSSPPTWATLGLHVYLLYSIVIVVAVRVPAIRTAREVRLATEDSDDSEDREDPATPHTTSTAWRRWVHIASDMVGLVVWALWAAQWYWLGLALMSKDKKHHHGSMGMQMIFATDKSKHAMQKLVKELTQDFVNRMEQYNAYFDDGKIWFSLYSSLLPVCIVCVVYLCTLSDKGMRQKSRSAYRGVQAFADLAFVICTVAIQQFTFEVKNDWRFEIFVALYAAVDLAMFKSPLKWVDEYCPTLKPCVKHPGLTIEIQD